jgi:hypothetical protein
VTDDQTSREEILEHANSNLQRLIEAVGGLLSASAELLARLQQILSGAQPATGMNGSDESGTSPPPTADFRDC